MLVKKEVCSLIKILHTDHEGEYNSQEFANFYETYGIKKQLTTSYTYQKMEFVKGKIVLLWIWCEAFYQEVQFKRVSGLNQ